MTELKPLTFEQLLTRIFDEYQYQQTIFYLSWRYFYRRKDGLDFSCRFRDQQAATPVGPAAGPHTQLAQNIITAWLAGARIIELKTVQVKDDLEIPRPCIDVSNVCFNVEWSQELSIAAALEEYVKAWYLIHILPKANIGGLSEETAPTLFDLSVGYDLKGIQSEKVLGFIRGMQDASASIDALRREIPTRFAVYREAPVPPQIASGVTLSTFHGCPPDEIEKIAVFLMKELGLNTVIKLNPTLLGPERMEQLLHEQLGYHQVQVPASAFANDLQFTTAVDMVGRLQQVARSYGRHFGVKFNNTLVTVNQGRRFSPSEMYMSGRPLHVIAMNLVAEFRKIFGASLPISFSAGIDAENLPAAVAANLVPITVCTDLLRPGGYSRLFRYLQGLSQSMQQSQASNRDDYILNFLNHGHQALIAALDHSDWQDQCQQQPPLAVFSQQLRQLIEQLPPAQAFIQARQSIAEATLVEMQPQLQELYQQAVAHAGMMNSAVVATAVQNDERYTAYRNRAYSPKVDYQGRQFDCISAPCTYACPVHINVPKYIELIRHGQFAEAIAVIRENNPLPQICGRVCSHPCQDACRQAQWDAPVAIRALKRFVADLEAQDPVAAPPVERKSEKVAIVGSGPAGLTAAYFLARAGYPVTIFESRPSPGGMLAYGIPHFRLPQEVLNQEIARIQSLGVEIRCNSKIGGDGITIPQLRQQGYQAIFVAIGAYKSRRLAIDGEDSSGCLDCLQFLRDVRSGKKSGIGNRVAVIGGGNAAIDSARTAWRLDCQKVYLVYRRSRSQMPANIAEIDELVKEGVEIIEQAMPVRILSENGKLTAIECVKTSLGQLDASGRARPLPVPESNFTLEVDSVIIAVSQQPLLEQLLAGVDLTVEARQTLSVDAATLATKIPGVFAGGDVVRGADTIISAMGDGRRAAQVIERYLRGESLQLPAEAKSKGARDPDQQATAWEIPAALPSVLPEEQRRSFAEVENGFTVEPAQQEAARCLHCDLQCDVCIEVCPNRANFFFATPTEQTPYPILGYVGSEIIPVAHGVYQVNSPHQIGNFADLCNQCGNCDNFCPESGGPYRVKSSFFP